MVMTSPLMMNLTTETHTCSNLRKHRLKALEIELGKDTPDYLRVIAARIGDGFLAGEKRRRQKQD